MNRSEWDSWEAVRTTEDYIRQVDEHSCGVRRLASDRTLDKWDNDNVEATRAAAKE
jgi:hypothetical protein